MIKNLIELQSITTKDEMEDFIIFNLFDKEFIYTVMFLLDDLRTTGIDRKKLDKAKPIKSNEINNHIELIDYVLKNNTGKMDVVNNVKYHLENTFEDSEILSEIITKNFKLGMTKKTWNKIVPIQYRVFEVQYMGCIPYSESAVDNLFEKNTTIYSQTKEDGQFLFISCRGGRVQDILSRNGQRQYLENCDFISKINQSSFDDRSFVLNGEILIKGFNNRSEANGIIRGFISTNSKIKENNRDLEIKKFENKYKISYESIRKNIYYVIWDLIPYDSYIQQSFTTKYSNRFTDVRNLVMDINSDLIKVVDTQIVKNKKEALQHLSKNLKLGLEGTILKSPSNIFKNGKPTSQVKLKIDFNLDLKIVGFNEGDGKYKKTLGSIELESKDGILKTGAGGFTDKEKDEIWNNKDLYLNKIAEIKCNGISKDKNGNPSLFYANFIKIRDDKDVANTYDEILDIERSIIELGGNNGE